MKLLETEDMHRILKDLCLGDTPRIRISVYNPNTGEYTTGPYNAIYIFPERDLLLFVIASTPSLVVQNRLYLTLEKVISFLSTLKIPKLELPRFR